MWCVLYDLLPELQLGDECEYTEDCQSIVSYSVCNDNNVCACPDGEQVYDNGDQMYCYESSLGEECTTDDQCLCKCVPNVIMEVTHLHHLCQLNQTI